MLQQLSDAPDFLVGVLIGLRFIATNVAMLIMIIWGNKSEKGFGLYLRGVFNV